ncbi:MAG: DNA polymerase I, partial [Leptospira sp.]|nr:DNA polymerase I [Leptospira sp.]
AEIVGISMTDSEGEGCYIPVSFEGSLFAKSSLPKKEVLDAVKDLLENKKIKKVGQNIKYDAIVLKNCGINLENIFFDTMIASYIIQPGARRHNMDDMAEDYLNYKTITFDDLVGTGKKRQEIYNIELEKVGEYASEDADITFRLYGVLKDKLVEMKGQDVFEKIEMPLIDVLLSMEMDGVAIDVKYFRDLSKTFEKNLAKLEKSIHVHAGRSFNIASTKELQSILFEDLKLPTDKKTQTGFSTDHSVLETLQGMHPIIDDLLEHRKYAKLKSTYIDVLPDLVNPKTGRIHTSYNQTIAATGRLSSTDPNLQNIPIRDVEGRMIRRGFISPGEDFEILSLDY